MLISICSSPGSNSRTFLVKASKRKAFRLSRSSVATIGFSQQRNASSVAASTGGAVEFLVMKLRGPVSAPSRAIYERCNASEWDFWRSQTFRNIAQPSSCCLSHKIMWNKLTHPANSWAQMLLFVLWAIMWYFYLDSLQMQRGNLYHQKFWSFSLMHVFVFVWEFGSER